MDEHLPISKVVERILRKVIFVEQSILEGRGPCWIFQGRLNRNGYGRAWYNPVKKEIPCHRILYCEMVGPLIKGLVLDHLCRTRACCNPWHVEQVTHKVNVYRGEAILYRAQHEYSNSIFEIKRDPTAGTRAAGDQRRACACLSPGDCRDAAQDRNLRAASFSAMAGYEIYCGKGSRLGAESERAIQQDVPW